jgi:hypothetical protein
MLWHVLVGPGVRRSSYGQEEHVYEMADIEQIFKEDLKEAWFQYTYMARQREGKQGRW